MGQLAKQMAERSTDNFGANTEMNPKEECKVIFIKKNKFLFVVSYVCFFWESDSSAWCRNKKKNILRRDSDTQLAY